MRDIFPSTRLLALAIAITTNGIGLVTIGGPFLAGYLADNHGVRSVFWFGSPPRRSAASSRCSSSPTCPCG